MLHKPKPGHSDHNTVTGAAASSAFFHRQLLNTIRRFDAEVLRLQLVSPGSEAWPTAEQWWAVHCQGTEADVLRTFLEETKQGRGLKTIKEVLRDVPRSAHIQNLGILVLKLTLELLKERRHMQTLFKQRSEASIETAESFKKPTNRVRESLRVVQAMKHELTRRDSRDNERMRQFSNAPHTALRSASLKIRCGLELLTNRARKAPPFCSSTPFLFQNVNRCLFVFQVHRPHPVSFSSLAPSQGTTRTAQGPPRPTVTIRAAPRPNKSR